MRNVVKQAAQEFRIAAAYCAFGSVCHNQMGMSLEAANELMQSITETGKGGTSR